MRVVWCGLHGASGKSTTRMSRNDQRPTRQRRGLGAGWRGCGSMAVGGQCDKRTGIMSHAGRLASGLGRARRRVGRAGQVGVRMREKGPKMATEPRSGTKRRDSGAPSEGAPGKRPGREFRTRTRGGRSVPIRARTRFRGHFRTEILHGDPRRDKNATKERDKRTGILSRGGVGSGLTGLRRCGWRSKDDLGGRGRCGDASSAKEKSRRRPKKFRPRPGG